MIDFPCHVAKLVCSMTTDFYLLLTSEWVCEQMSIVNIASRLIKYKEQLHFTRDDKTCNFL
jgi:hypothetical protein